MTCQPDERSKAVNSLTIDQIKSSLIDLRLHGWTNAETLRGILGDSYSEAEMQALARRKDNLYREAYRPHVQPVRGLVAFLDQARAMGIPMAVTTFYPPGSAPVD